MGSSRGPLSADPSPQWRKDDGPEQCHHRQCVWALFIGYCIYFHRKRRVTPNFKNRLRERRKKQKLAKERAGLSKLLDLKDAEAVQKFSLEEIQLGEELLAQGEYEKGVDHLTKAIAVCGQPQLLLQVLQQTLPPPVFQMLLAKLPTIRGL